MPEDVLLGLLKMPGEGLTAECEEWSVRGIHLVLVTQLTQRTVIRFASSARRMHTDLRCALHPPLTRVIPSDKGHARCQEGRSVARAIQRHLLAVVGRSCS